MKVGNLIFLAHLSRIWMAIVKSSPPKVSGRFSNNFVEMFLGIPSSHVDWSKTMAAMGEAYMAKVRRKKIG